MAKPPSRPGKTKKPLDFITTPLVEKIARKGFFEGRLTSREIQEISGAVLAAIAMDKTIENAAKPDG